ncbi:unnamed protein product [Acidocella sp. C78]|uniref:TlpA family protein disulfide reductase n=1 Tax=Acidocella sp. C78 TaxID=1671486 RepID=UPI00191B927E|nr:TlpA disulfide reductase family protein [Acidocella sp. C78]CAG4923072.1 unnamed protein product [Acidocella sp. C78]
MRFGLSRRRFAQLGAGLVLPDLTSLAGIGKSAAAMTLPDVGPNLDATVPQPEPDFHFLDASGRRMTLAAFRGEGLVVNFWATWCPPCRAELPTLLALDPKIRADGMRVLPISVDSQGIKAVRPYFARHHITGVPMLLDPSSSALDAFNIGGIPFTVIVDRAGQMVASLQGAGDWDTPATIARLRRLVGPKPAAAPPTTST